MRERRSPLRLRQVFGFGVLSAAFAVSSASAQPGSADRAPAGSDRAGRAPAMKERGADKNERDQGAGRDKAKDQRKDEKERGPGDGRGDRERADPPGAQGGPGSMGADRRHGRRSSEVHAAIAEFRAGKITKEELKQRLTKLRDNVADRRKAHREELKERWGSTLANPSAQEELRHHARRMARLNRALVVAQTEDKLKDKAKITERIESLTQKENERHERAMTRLSSGAFPGTPAAARNAPGASSGTPAAPGAAAPGKTPVDKGGAQ